MCTYIICIQVWALAGQTGYVYKFSVQGDNMIQRDQALEPGIGASGQVVLDLLEGVGPGRAVFFDNYFASPALLLKLRWERDRDTDTDTDRDR